MEEEKQNQLVNLPSELEMFLLRFFEDNYTPCQAMDEADVKLSTTDLIRKLLQHYPTESIPANLLIGILQDLGYCYTDETGEMDMVWLFKTLS